MRSDSAEQCCCSEKLLGKRIVDGAKIESNWAREMRTPFCVQIPRTVSLCMSGNDFLHLVNHSDIFFPPKIPQLKKHNV